MSESAGTVSMGRHRDSACAHSNDVQCVTTHTARMSTARVRVSRVHGYTHNNLALNYLALSLRLQTIIKTLLVASTRTTVVLYLARTATLLIRVYAVFLFVRSIFLLLMLIGPHRIAYNINSYTSEAIKSLYKIKNSSHSVAEGFSQMTGYTT